MRRSFIAAMACCTLVAGAGQPQQPQQCINPQMLDGFVFLGRSDRKVTVTRALPVAMRGFLAPAGFGLIGTGVGADAVTTVAYKASMASDKAYTALLAALGAEGWAVEATADAARTFLVAGGPRDGTVCRGGERRYLTAEEAAGATYAKIRMAPQLGRHDCNTPDPLQLSTMQETPDAPRFQFPAGTTVRPGGYGGSNIHYTMSMRIVSAGTPAVLGEYLASQLAAGGWQQDAAWSGSTSVGSTWRRRVDGRLLSGTLEILRVSGGFDVDFSLVRAQQE